MILNVINLSNSKYVTTFNHCFNQYTWAKYFLSIERTICVFIYLLTYNLWFAWWLSSSVLDHSPGDVGEECSVPDVTMATIRHTKPGITRHADEQLKKDTIQIKWI